MHTAMKYSHLVDPQTCFLSVYHSLLIGPNFRLFLLMNVLEMLEMQLAIGKTPTSGSADLLPCVTAQQIRVKFISAVF